MCGETSHRVIKANEQREVAAPGRIGDGGGHAVAILLQDFQWRVRGIVGQVEEPRLGGVPVHEAERLIGEEVGGVAIELLQLPAAVDHVVRVGGAELRLGVPVEQVSVPTHE